MTAPSLPIPTIPPLSGPALVTAVNNSLGNAQSFWQSMQNGCIAASVSGNALTLAVKTLAGADPSAADPVTLWFRSATTSSGVFVPVKVTSVLSITIPVSATLGHASARDQQIILYAMNNAGGAELAVSTKFFDPSVRLTTTTTISPAATSPSTMYSATGRSNIPFGAIARCISNQTAAGTWAAVPSQIDLAPFALPTNPFYAYPVADQTGVANGTFTKVALTGKSFDPDNVFDATTNYRFQPKMAGKYMLCLHLGILNAAPSYALVLIYFNGGENSRFGIAPGVTTDVYPAGAAVLDFNGTTDYAEMYGYQASGSSQTFRGNPSFTSFSGARVGA